MKTIKDLKRLVNKIKPFMCPLLPLIYVRQLPSGVLQVGCGTPSLFAVAEMATKATARWELATGKAAFRQANPNSQVHELARQVPTTPVKWPFRLDAHLSNAQALEGPKVFQRAVDLISTQDRKFDYMHLEGPYAHSTNSRIAIREGLNSSYPSSVIPLSVLRRITKSVRIGYSGGGFVGVQLADNVVVWSDQKVNLSISALFLQTDRLSRVRLKEPPAYTTRRAEGYDGPVQYARIPFTELEHADSQEAVDVRLSTYIQALEIAAPNGEYLMYYPAHKAGSENVVLETPGLEVLLGGNYIRQA